MPPTHPSRLSSSTAPMNREFCTLKQLHPLRLGIVGSLMFEQLHKRTDRMGLSNKLLRFLMTMNQRTELWVKKFSLIYKSRSQHRSCVKCTVSSSAFWSFCFSSEHDLWTQWHQKRKTRKQDLHSWLAQWQLQRIPKWFSLLLIRTASDAVIWSIWAKQLSQERITEIQLCIFFLFKIFICLSLRKIDSKVSVDGLGLICKTAKF